MEASIQRSRNVPPIHVAFGPFQRTMPYCSLFSIRSSMMRRESLAFLCKGTGLSCRICTADNRPSSSRTAYLKCKSLYRLPLGICKRMPFAPKMLLLFQWKCSVPSVFTAGISCFSQRQSLLVLFDCHAGHVR